MPFAARYFDGRSRRYGNVCRRSAARRRVARLGAWSFVVAAKSAPMPWRCLAARWC